MRSRARLLFPVVLILASFTLKAQCDSNVQSLAYDTSVSGSANDYYQFNFPRFDPAMGTLVDVEIRTKMTLRYSFMLENRENTAINYRVRVQRDDEISSEALPAPQVNTFQKNYGIYKLSAQDGNNGMGPDYVESGVIYPMENFSYKNKYYNTADFMGNGNVGFDYYSSTYSIVFGSMNYNFNANADDTLNFQISYQYCPLTRLASGITSFSAGRKNDMTYIKWNAMNEAEGTEYTIQRSMNGGRNFQDLRKVRAHMDQQGKYSINLETSNTTGKAIYRLAISVSYGEPSYSVLRQVDYGTTGQTSFIYPNPSNGQAQLLLHKTERSDWKIDVYTIGGQLTESFSVNKSLTARINSTGRLKPGTYIVKANNLNTGESITEKLVVAH